jgi:hypothetical protein
MKSLLFLIVLNTSLIGGLTNSGIDKLNIYRFNKYKVVLMGKTLTESTTPTFISIGKDSIKFLGGFVHSFGIKTDIGNMLEMWNGWFITNTGEIFLCQSPDFSLSIHFSEPIEDTTLIPDNLKPNQELKDQNIPDRNRRLHNMPVFVPDDKDVPYMPVYDPGPDYNGFLLIAGQKDSGSPKYWLDNFKNSFFVLNDSITIPKLER